MPVVYVGCCIRNEPTQLVSLHDGRNKDHIDVFQTRYLTEVYNRIQPSSQTQSDKVIRHIMTHPTLRFSKSHKKHKTSLDTNSGGIESDY